MSEAIAETTPVEAAGTIDSEVRFLSAGREMCARGLRRLAAPGVELTKRVARYILRDELAMDPLTELPNRMLMDKTLIRNAGHYIRHDTPCVALFLDVDHFKWVNDGLGHDMGDLALLKFADILKHQFRHDTDSVYRYGGEEFVGVMEDCESDPALERAEDIRKIVEEMEIELPSDFNLGKDYYRRELDERPHVIARDGKLFLKLTVSIGVTAISDIPKTQTRTSPETLAKEVVRYADQGLFYAKNSGGRNCVCYHSGPNNFIILHPEHIFPLEQSSMERNSVPPHSLSPSIPLPGYMLIPFSSCGKGQGRVVRPWGSERHL